VRRLAVIIPESIPSKASKGVHHLFSALSSLPDEFLIYYEPLKNPSHPDFIIIGPYLGLLVIEIRDWYPKHIQKVTKTRVYIENNGKRREDNPLFRAQHFLNQLSRKAKKNPVFADLLDKSPISDGFRFPSGILLVLPNCTGYQLIHHTKGNLYEALGSDHILFREKFSGIEQWDVVELLRFLKSCVVQRRGTVPLTCEQVQLLRGIIHEDILIDLPAIKKAGSDPVAASLTILDRNQEQVLHRISSGHHLLSGPQGSGKTTILLARSLLQQIRREEDRILFLCYTKPALDTITGSLKRNPRIDICSFQDWAGQQGVIRDGTGKDTESDQEFGERCYRHILQGSPGFHAYDAVFIDEGHMFPVSWFRCAREALQEPDTGDLCIASDEQKSMSGPRGKKWQEIGIHFRGHIHHLKGIPEKEFQNTVEILRLARLFLLPGVDSDEEYRNLSRLCGCRIRTGLKPLLIWNTSHEHQVEYALFLVQRLVSSIKSAQHLSGIQPDGIAVLYPYADGSDKFLISSLITLLSRVCPVQWVSEESTTYDRVNYPGLKVHDCYSIQGHFYRVVIILFAEKFEWFFSDIGVFSGRNLLYMALTRPLDFLTIQYTDMTESIKKILNSGYVDEFKGK
jgi:hypothetical protein